TGCEPRQDGCGERANDPERERSPVAACPARLERAEQDRDQQDSLEPLAEEDREREEEGDQRRGEARLGQREVDRAEVAPDSGRGALERAERLAFADAVAKRGELELEVEHDVRRSQPQRDLGPLEVIEVRSSRGAIRLRPIASACLVERTVDEDSRLLHLVARLAQLVAARRSQTGREQRSGG